MAIYLMALCFSLAFFQGGEEAKEKRSPDPNAPMRWRSGLGMKKSTIKCLQMNFSFFRQELKWKEADHGITAFVNKQAMLVLDWPLKDGVLETTLWVFLTDQALPLYLLVQGEACNKDMVWWLTWKLLHFPFCGSDSEFVSTSRSLMLPTRIALGMNRSIDQSRAATPLLHCSLWGKPWGTKTKRTQGKCEKLCSKNFWV